MSDGRKPKFKEPIQDLDLPQVKVELESEAKAPLTVEQIYLKRQGQRGFFGLSTEKGCPR